MTKAVATAAAAAEVAEADEGDVTLETEARAWMRAVTASVRARICIDETGPP